MRNFSFIILSTCLVTLCSTSVYAGKPEGDKAGGKDGICVSLKEKGVTPGLYGLCVAYHSSGADSLALLDKYNAKKGPSDPIMPGTDEPDPEGDLALCVCWNHLEMCEIGGTLAEFPDSGFSLDPNVETPYFDGVFYQDYESDFAEALIVEGDTCFYSISDGVDAYYPDPISGLTESEEATCRQEIIELVDRDFFNVGCIIE